MKLLLLAAAIALAPFSPCLAAPLSIANNTEQTILNILAETKDRENFLRLDLPPGVRDSVENPGGVAALRVDTGLQFWKFANIDLAKTRRLIFCEQHPVCLVCEYDDGKFSHIKGSSQDLVPAPGAAPVCNLDTFHPAMPMKDVCAILPEHMPRDDNGALLTGMGFGGMAWAARLVPAQNGKVSENTLLEHLELRRPLNRADFEKLVTALYKKGYVPWQAEFPRLDLEFDSNADEAKSTQALLHAMNRFMENQQAAPHANHAAGEKCEEASVILAPAKLLPRLEKAEEPGSDVQIYTIYLRPCSHTLLLDVAAYRGNE